MLSRTIPLLLVLCACRSSFVYEETGGSLLLAETETEGAKVSWRLQPGPGRGNAPHLERTEASSTPRARVGVTVSPVTRARADSAELEPWRGVWVDVVDPRGPAAKAGIVARDVILRVDGVDVSSAEQFTDLVRTHGVPGEPLDLELSIYRGAGEPLNGPRSAVVVVVPDSVADRQSRTESVELDYSPAYQTYTGLQVGEVPAALARDAFGAEEPVVVVTGVVVGSPAYAAGFRPGDRVRECDGAPVTSLNDLRAALRTRFADRRLPLEDLARIPLAESGAKPGASLALVVDGPLGDHAASLAVDEDMRDQTVVDVPILLEYKRSIDRKRVSFLDFIFQFGFNYHRRTHPSETREPKETWDLSILPFGMFEFEHHRNGHRTTLFWFIDLGRSH